jgi:Flp pilus assembly protein TadG
MGARLRPLLRREDGTAVLELGLAIPVVFVLLLGMIDLARGYSIKLQLEQVAQRSVEKVMNGMADRTQLAAIKAEAATAAGVAQSAVTTNAWLECSSGTGTPTYYNYPTDDDQPCPNGQTSRRYLKVTIVKTFSPIFSFQWSGANADGTYTITGANAVRTQ